MKDNQDDCQNGSRLLSACTYGHSNLVIYHHPVASKFRIWITFIKRSPKFEHGFCPIAKMPVKMAFTYRFALVDILTSLFITKCIPNFIYKILFSNIFEYIFCSIKNSHDGCRNGRCLWSVYTCAHSFFVFTQSLPKCTCIKGIF